MSYSSLEYRVSRVRKLAREVATAAREGQEARVETLIQRIGQTVRDAK